VKKTTLPPGNNQKTCFEGLDPMCVKKTAILCCIIKQQDSQLRGRAVGQKKSSILWFPKTMVFHLFYGLGFPFSSRTAHCISYLSI
jgi:hypothetical protein